MIQCDYCDYKKHKDKKWCFIFPRRPKEPNKCPKFRHKPEPRYANETR